MEISIVSDQYSTNFDKKYNEYLKDDDDVNDKINIILGLNNELDMHVSAGIKILILCDITLETEHPLNLLKEQISITKNENATLLESQNKRKKQSII